MKKLSVFLILAITALILGILFWMLSSREYQTAQAPLLAAPKSPKPPALLIWAYGSPALADQYKSTLQELQKVYPNSLTLKMFPSRDLMQSAVLQSAKVGTLPDVLLGEVQDLAPLFQAHLLSPIPLKDTPSSEWIPDIFKLFQRGESLMAYPSEYSVLVLYFNRRHFDRVGLAYADTYWTWTTVLEMSRALYRPADSQGGLVYGLEMDPNFELWNTLSCGFGMGIYSGSRWQWANPEAAGPIRDALQMLVEFERNYIVSAPVTHDPLPQQFLQGRCALAVAGPGLRTLLKKDSSFQWGCTVLPKVTSLATPLSARGWAISASTKAVDAAQGVARALSSHTADGWLPARSPSPTSPESVDDYASVFQVSLRYAQPPFTGAHAQQIKELFDQALNRLVDPAGPDPDQLISGLNSSLAPLQTPSTSTPAVPASEPASP